MREMKKEIITILLVITAVLFAGCIGSDKPVVPEQVQQTITPVSTSSMTAAMTPHPVTTIVTDATTNTPGTPSCSSGQTRCDGSCIDMQSNSQHCGACGNVCNTSEPCSEGKCLSWAGSWERVNGWKYELTQTGTSVSGTDYTNQEIFSGSTSGNPPRLTGTWVSHGRISDPFTLDMAPDGKSFSGGLLGKNTLTWTRVQN